MNWKKKLLEIEENFGLHKDINWGPAIKLVNDLLHKNPDNVELNVRAIYLLHNILVEEKYSKEEESWMTKLLQKWLYQSKDKFSENAEYLFFIGKILHIANWYFGLENNKLALKFQKMAMEREPSRLLYEWAYRLSCSEDILEGNLAHQLIEGHKSEISWLKSKGFPGDYVLEQLITGNLEYLDKISRIKKA